ncbi:MAG: DNA primase [Gemmataceae bacterium]
MADDRVKQVKQANDIYDVVSGYLALRPAGGTYKGLCPFHEDSRPSFDVDPRRQRYRCWSCGKHGDVLSFVQEFERLSFPETLELLARRAGIQLDGPTQVQGENRAHLLDVMRWAAKQFHECLIDSEVLAAEAQKYVGERGLLGDTVRKWGLGFAPPSGHWLVDLAGRAGVSLELLEKVGLVAQRQEGQGYYDRFRDRVQFPIRDVRGQVVGFGGRILPNSPLAARAPKYYNSCDTPLFSKSEQLYGIDQARAASEKAGYLAIVEGYTDVLMAHQCGVEPVVATMGTALNDRHVKQLRRFVRRVVLVFDADAGGDQGVDRALELFAGHDMELAVATLPVGLDPCDLLVRSGAEAFRRVLASAIDALEFKLNVMVAREDTSSVEGRKRVADAVLKVIAPASVLPGESGALKTELIVTRLAQRLALKEESLWKRLAELRRTSRQAATDQGGTPDPAAAKGAAPAAPEDRRLVEILLAEPGLVGQAFAGVRAEEIQHPGLRRLLAGLYTLHAAGQPPTLDALRPDLQDSPALLNKAFQLMNDGADRPNRPAELAGLLAHFRQRRERSAKEELKSRLQAGADDQTGMEILRRLQNRIGEPGPDTSSEGGGPLPPAA